jgi:hypothetical protein
MGASRASVIRSSVGLITFGFGRVKSRR